MKFQVHTKDTAPETSRATLEATAKKYGFVPNLYGVLAGSPAAVQAYAGINKALEQSVLTPVEQQVVTLVVSTANDCTYCVGAHSTVAQMVRMPEDVLDALRAQRQLPDRKLNALKTLVMSVLLHRGWVPDEDLEFFVAAGYGPQHLLDVLTIVALKTLSNYTNHIAHTPLDPQFAAHAWTAQAATGG
ncbi:MAG: carboxymuconolactone decarboxylase family protein [Nitrospira sp.]|nr:carboxymuconolactone decarboxylase family protein [Nitrospira sp.]